LTPRSLERSNIIPIPHRGAGNPDQREAVLRVLAPNKAIGRKATAENFPDDYLTPYLRAVWDHYRAGGAAPPGAPSPPPRWT